MGNKNTKRLKERRGISAKALRKAGYVPLPRWWVLPDEMDVIHRMAHNHQNEVNRIRAEALRRAGYKTAEDDDEQF